MSRVICQMAASPPHTHLCTSLYSLHFSGRVHDPLKSTPSVGDSGPHLIRGFFGSHVSAAEPHLDWFRSCCTAYLSAKHIPVDHATCDMHNKGPRVSTHWVMRRKHWQRGSIGDAARGMDSCSSILIGRPLIHTLYS